MSNPHQGVVPSEWWPRTPEPQQTIFRDLLGSVEKSISDTELAQRLKKLNNELATAHQDVAQSTRRVRSARGNFEAHGRAAVAHASYLNRVTWLREEIGRVMALQESN